MQKVFSLTRNGPTAHVKRREHDSSVTQSDQARLGKTRCLLSTTPSITYANILKVHTDIGGAEIIITHE